MLQANGTTNRTSIKDVKWIYQEVRYIWVEYIVVFFFVTTILANIILMIALLKSRHRRTSSLTCHMLNTATAQLLLGLFSVPFANFGHWGLLQWMFHRINVPLCYIAFTSDRLLIVATLMAVLMLATDCLFYLTKQRFGSISWRPTKWKLTAMLAFPWCISIAATLMLTLNTKLVFFEDVRGCSPVTNVATETIFLLVCIVIPSTLLFVVTIALLLYNKMGAHSLTVSSDDPSRLLVNADPLQIGNRICLGCFIYLTMWTWFLIEEINKGIGCRGNVQCLLKFHDGPVPYVIACANAVVTPAVWMLFPEIGQTLWKMVKCSHTSNSQRDGYLRQEAIPLNQDEAIATSYKDEIPIDHTGFSQPL